MCKKLFFVLLLLPFVYSCNNQTPTDADGVIVAKGGVRYGGTFHFMSNEKVDNLFPLSTNDVYSARVISQIFEGLVCLDPGTSDLEPALAKKISVNDSSTSFVFHLRTDVYFQDDPCFKDGKGRKVTANDFKYALEFACSNNEKNKISYLLTGKIAGSEAYYNGYAKHVSGIVVKNDSTLVIKLASPFSGFEKVLTHSGLGVFPKEAYEKYGDEIGKHPVGTGAFILDSLTESKIVLKRNDNYWRKDEFGNPLPFLSKIVMGYSKNKKDEILSFRKEKTDLVVGIPVDEIQYILGSLKDAKQGKNVKHIIDSKSSLSISYFGFSLDHGVFTNKKVRKAFNMAIDRKSIIENDLEGEGWAVTHGFVPKMEGYPIEKVKGYKYQPEEAKKLMAEAGYPNGSGFPTIPLYINTNEGTSKARAAKAVQKYLKDNLGVNIEIKYVTFADREKAIQDGNAVFWWSVWIADYPDPENFLNMFYYGKHFSQYATSINPFKYHNKKFDSLFNLALVEPNEDKRMLLLTQCDQIIVDDAVVMPLLTDDFVTMVNLKVRNFKTNDMEQLDFSTVYIKEAK